MTLELRNRNGSVPVSMGDSVVFNCTTHTDEQNNAGLQLVCTPMGSNTKKVWDTCPVKSHYANVCAEKQTFLLLSLIREEITDQRFSQPKGFYYVLSNITHEHQGVYTCGDDGTLPDVAVLDWHYIIWVTGRQPTIISCNMCKDKNHNVIFTLCASQTHYLELLLHVPTKILVMLL